MLRRFYIFCLLAALSSATPALGQEWGVGLSLEVSPLGGLPGSDAMLSVKTPELPITFGVGARLTREEFQFGMTADWILIRENLFSFVNVYVGPGLYLSLPDRLDLGGRVPIGLNAFPAEWLELFLEIAPRLAFISDGGIDIPDVGLQSGFGFRFWFET